jgi:hypothetical protein
MRSKYPDRVSTEKMLMTYLPKEYSDDDRNWIYRWFDQHAIRTIDGHWCILSKEPDLKPFTSVKIPMRRRDFTSADKLIQILMSILAGCQTLSEVNPKLRSELGLAKIWGWDRIADQSSLSRTLDRLIQKQYSWDLTTCL